MIKRWLKSFWQSFQKKGREEKKEKKTRMTIAKPFVLNANKKFFFTERLLSIISD